MALNQKTNFDFITHSDCWTASLALEKSKNRISIYLQFIPLKKRQFVSDLPITCDAPEKNKKSQNKLKNPNVDEIYDATSSI